MIFFTWVFSVIAIWQVQVVRALHIVVGDMWLGSVEISPSGEASDFTQDLLRAVAKALIGGCIFIYSCYVRLISFKIGCN